MCWSTTIINHDSYLSSSSNVRFCLLLALSLKSSPANSGKTLSLFSINYGGPHRPAPPLVLSSPSVVWARQKGSRTCCRAYNKNSTAHIRVSGRAGMFAAGCSGGFLTTLWGLTILRFRSSTLDRPVVRFHTASSSGFTTTCSVPAHAAQRSGRQGNHREISAEDSLSG